MKQIPPSCVTQRADVAVVLVFAGAYLLQAVRQHMQHKRVPARPAVSAASNSCEALQLRDYCALVLLQTLGVKQLVAASRACAPIGCEPCSWLSLCTASGDLLWCVVPL